MRELKLEYTLSGTFDDFVKEYKIFNRFYEIEKHWENLSYTMALREINGFINKQLDEKTEIMQKFLYNKIISSEEIEFRVLNKALDTFRPAIHLLFNATDAITDKFSQSEPDYEACVDLRVSFNEKRFWFEIEDNGIGIDPNVEPLLYQRLSSLKKGRDELFGGQGYSLTVVKSEILKMKGSFYHRNKGENQGAVFGYFIPLDF